VVDENIPVIVLINRASASASEIVAGALKDTHRAYLVCEKSYGKGSVQIPTPLIANDGFKITVAKYYSPTDVNIDKIGIPADRKVDYPEFTEDEEKAYSALMSDDKITEYVENHPGMTDVDIGSYAVNLQKDYNVDLRIIRKVIRNEVERTRKPRLYDLDYDVQLNAALDMFANEDVLALSKSAKTLKEIQAESDTKSDKK
jgi:carboxyl-terminal processing protease